MSSQNNNSELQSQLRILITSFLSNIAINQKYLLKSQQDLSTILDTCSNKTQSITQSAMVSQQKLRIPKLQGRIQGLSKMFYDAHKRIQGINRNMAQLDKIQLLQAELEGRAVEKSGEQGKIQGEGYEDVINKKKSSTEQKNNQNNIQQKQETNQIPEKQAQNQ